MKKIYFSCLVLIALGLFLIFFGINQNIAFIMVGALCLGYGVLRFFLIKSASQYQESSNSDDMIVKYLKTDENLYAHMLSVYKRGNSSLIYGEHDGVLIYDEVSDYYLASAKSKVAAYDIVSKVKSFKFLICFDEVLFDEVEKQLHISKYEQAYTLIYQKQQRFNNESNVEIKALDDSYKQIIKEHYTYASEYPDSFFEGRIRQGMLGAFINQELVGFIGRHEYGAIGLLEVFKDYQRKHIGTLLMASYVNYLIDLDDSGMIYCEVISKNTASLGLCKKLGFKQASQCARWYWG